MFTGQAHDALDRAVWAAYGWEGAPGETEDETILRRLLALNLERAGVGGGAAAPTPAIRQPAD